MIASLAVDLAASPAVFGVLILVVVALRAPLACGPLSGPTLAFALGWAMRLAIL